MHPVDRQDPSPATEPSSAETFVGELARRASAARHRYAVVLSGTRAWGIETAQSLQTTLNPERCLWLGEDSPPGMESLPPGKARGELGRECDLLVFDAWNGFDPDAFGAASGTLRGGGLLLLLTPPLDDWPRPERPGQDASTGRFIRRLVRLLSSDAAVYVITPETSRPIRELPPPTPVTLPPTIVPAPFLSDDQRQAVETLMHVVTGQRRRPAVLISDRGRGKSSAFGLAAARLMQTGIRNIIVTAPRYTAVEKVFEQAGEQLPAARRQRGYLETGSARMTFVAPDELLRQPRPADLLLVDEAAAIPTPMLEALLAAYPRIAFATTVHGYEGTGRGFALRFQRHLQTHSRGWKPLRMREPIRWAANDPLEAFVFRALGLDAEPAPGEAVADAVPERCEIERLDRETLADDDVGLRELFGLLVLAHYRTRPVDLQHLLDAPDLDIYAMRYTGHVVATALVAHEGGLSPEVADAVWAGRRRPHGHLVPEALTAHLGLKEASCLRCARIVRIAVHPDLQSRGLGSALLKTLTETAHADGMDYVGTSFGATVPLLRFWMRAEWRPVRIAITSGATSGERSTLLIRGLNEAGHTLVSAARARFHRQFPDQLTDPLRDLAPELAAAILSDGPAGADRNALSLDIADWQDLLAFAYTHRPYEGCIAGLHTLALHGLSDPAAASRLDTREKQILILKPLQGRDWQAVAAMLGLAGREAVIASLRRACRELIGFYAERALPTELQDQMLRLAAERH